MTTPHRDVAAAPILKDHIGHWVKVIDHKTLRCHPCQHTIVLPPAPLSGRHTPAVSALPHAPRDPKPHETCPKHPGEFDGACRCCAADRRALRDPSTPPPVSQVRTGVEPPAEVAETLEQINARIRARKAQEAREAAAHNAHLSPPEPTVDTQEQTPTASEEATP